MAYIVSRQNGFYDDQPRIEIATGRDEISPGMLVARYDEEGEYDSPREAVEAAIKLQETLTGMVDEQDWPITISGMASLGLYPTPDDDWNVEELMKWAEKREAMELDDDNL